MWFPWTCHPFKINWKKNFFNFPFRIGIPQRSVTWVETMSLNLFLLLDTIPRIFPRFVIAVGIYSRVEPQIV